MQVSVTGDSVESALETVAVDSQKDQIDDEINVDSEELEKLKELETGA